MSTPIEIECNKIECKINSKLFNGLYSKENDGTIILGIEDEGFDDEFLKKIKEGLSTYMKASKMYFNRAVSEEGKPMIIVHLPKACFKL